MQFNINTPNETTHKTHTNTHQKKNTKQYSSPGARATPYIRRRRGTGWAGGGFVGAVVE